MGRSRRVSVLVVGALTACVALALAGTAVAQEYGGSTGELAVAGSAIPGGPLEVSGGGFVAGSVVYVVLTSEATGEVVDLGVLQTDSSGAFAGTVTLPGSVISGTYTLSATSVTADGVTRVLSADVEVVSVLGPTQPGEATGGWSSGRWILLIAGIVVSVSALAGGGWWLFGVRRRGVPG